MAGIWRRVCGAIGQLVIESQPAFDNGTSDFLWLWIGCLMEWNETKCIDLTASSGMIVRFSQRESTMHTVMVE
jgi:hypothetical protein